MQINSRYKRVLYMDPAGPIDQAPGQPASGLPGSGAGLAIGRIVDKLSPGEPGLRWWWLWSLFVSLFALAAMVYVELGCEPNLPKTSTLFVEKVSNARNVHI